MKKHIIRKNLVFGTIILLVLLSIPTNTSTINENMEKTVNQLTEHHPGKINSLNNDYIYGYWKFDEGNGNTAYDSSGYDHDGTIYGASWTTGNISYALDFDGFNDYVNFDGYSDLRFNKTDDIIFSFYLKTSSTEFGMIYSVSNPNGKAPDWDIYLNETGTIDLSIKNYDCGPTLQTENTFNDGQWHYVEIYYNGITANPTIKIYVDNELEGEKTQWVCNFWDELITKIKMGRDSNDSIDFFDGIIDEFKFVKYPGGNEQSPPEISGPTYGNANEEYEFSFITYDPEGDDIWLLVEWGDGNDTGWTGPYESGEEVIKTYKWSDGGVYKIKAKSMDIWDDGPPSYHTIYIGEQPPDPPIISGPTNGDIDENLEYTFVTNDYEEDDIELYINWDDGQLEYWIGPYGSGDEVKVSHAWTEKGTYEIKAKARDDSGEGDESEPYYVIIGNDPPNKPSINGSSSGNPGIEYTYKFLATDPEGDNIYYWISWGDGLVIEDFGPYTSGTEIQMTHTWSDQGSYKLEAWARDELGAVGEKANLYVTMPKNKEFVLNFPLVNWILENFPNALPILRYIMGL
jgi:hypothetical protein